MIDPGRMEFSWRSEPLHPRPGFGFYPDQVWQALENATQVGNTKHPPHQLKGKFCLIYLLAFFFSL